MTETRELPVWRSLLYVPVNQERFVAKAHTRGADALILDLEDSIAPSEKAGARTLVPDAAARVGQAGADVLVRINAPWDLARDDLKASICAAVGGLVLPKVEDAAHVRHLADRVSALEAAQGRTDGATVFFVLVETPQGVLRMEEIAAAHPRVVAISVGCEDLSAAMGTEPDALIYPNMHCLVCARAAGILPMGFIGTIADYKDLDAFRGMVERSRGLGFEGAAAIHPAQVAVLNQVHTPDAADADRARAMVAAYEAAYAQGVGAVEFEGRMIDVPVVERARNVVRRMDAIQARADKDTGAGI